MLLCIEVGVPTLCRCFPRPVLQSCDSCREMHRESRHFALFLRPLRRGSAAHVDSGLCSVTLFSEFCVWVFGAVMMVQFLHYCCVFNCATYNNDYDYYTIIILTTMKIHTLYNINYYKKKYYLLLLQFFLVTRTTIHTKEEY